MRSLILICDSIYDVRWLIARVEESSLFYAVKETPDAMQTKLVLENFGFQLRAELSIVGQYYHLQDDQLNLKLSVTSSACFG
ncbi:hypothetical protein SDJN02_25101, partial [Cucurbita argyrosperma subsp. argyrosperma]